MEMKELEIMIDRNGKVQVAVRGIKGEGCLTATQDLENALGNVEERGYTAEYYEQPVEMNRYREIGIK